MELITIILSLTIGAAVVASIALYWGLYRHGSASSPDQANAFPKVEPAEKAKSGAPLDIAKTSEPQKTRESEAPISEAPSPFPEDVVSFAKTTVPTDVSAIQGMGSAMAAGASPVLVIPIPKRKSTRAKRLTPPSEPTIGQGPVAGPISQVANTSPSTAATTRFAVGQAEEKLSGVFQSPVPKETRHKIASEKTGKAAEASSDPVAAGGQLSTTGSRRIRAHREEQLSQRQIEALLLVNDLKKGMSDSDWKDFLSNVDEFKNYNRAKRAKRVQAPTQTEVATAKDQVLENLARDAEPKMVTSKPLSRSKAIRKSSTPRTEAPVESTTGGFQAVPDVPRDA